MKVTVVYDEDGTKTDVIEGHRIAAQIFAGTTCGLVHVFNEHDIETATYHYTMVYRMHRDKQ